MDRSWVRENRMSEVYKTGLNSFLQTALEHTTVRHCILCPCRKCCNRYHHRERIVYEHLIIHGMESRYITAPWTNHGEVIRDMGNIEPITDNVVEPNPMGALLNDILGNQIVGEDVASSSHESEQHAEQMSAALEEYPPEIRNTPEVVNKAFEKEFADRLVGHGRVFGRGVGVKPSMLGYSNPSTSRGLAGTTAELEIMKAKFEASEAERARLKADIEKLKADAEAKKERFAQFQQNVNAQLQELRHELSRRPLVNDYMALQALYFREHGIPWMSSLSIPQTASQQFSIHQQDFMARPLTRPEFVRTTSNIGVPQMSENVNDENTPIRPTGESTMPFRGLSQMPEDSNDETNL